MPPRRRDPHFPAFDRHHDHPGLALANAGGDSGVAGARRDDRPDQGEGGDDSSDRTLRQAEQTMIYQGVRMLFVVNEMPVLEG
jgi:hypothetical protein